MRDQWSETSASFMTRRKFGIYEIPTGPIILSIGKEPGNEVYRNMSPILDINQSLNQSKNQSINQALATMIHFRQSRLTTLAA